jgi:hypothetical protein
VAGAVLNPDAVLNPLPGLQNTIKTAVVDMLMWPSRMVFPILEGDYRDLEFLPTGVLTVTLIEASGLMKTDIIGKSDPFVFLYGKSPLLQFLLPLLRFFFSVLNLYSTGFCITLCYVS